MQEQVRVQQQSKVEWGGGESGGEAGGRALEASRAKEGAKGGVHTTLSVRQWSPT